MNGERGAALGLFGRDAEIARVRDVLEEVSAGESGGGRLLLLAGESGVGKTALAQTAFRIADELDFDVFRIACEPFHEGMSFFPVRELVRQVAGGRSVTETVGDLFGRDSPEADVASVSDSSTADPTSRREAMVATFTNVIFGRFRSGTAAPLLFFIDDLEHLDAGSADALICVLARMSEGPVVILGAYRTDLLQDPSHPLKIVMSAARRGEDVLVPIQLGGFTAEVVPDLTEALLDGPCDLPLAFYDKLFTETEGNPLFVREVLKALVRPTDQSHVPPLAVVDGVWKFSGSIELWSIPASVEDVIASRLALLDDESRSELELAAVIGRRFAFEVLSELISAGEDTLLDHLEAFLSFDLIREIDQHDDSFEFSHGKIRDVLYDSLSGLRRRRMHGQVAKVLTKLQGVTNEDWDALIGEHLFQAAKHADAFPYLLRAARNARIIGSATEGVALFRKTLSASEGAVLEASDSRQSIQLELTEALLATSETDEAASLLEQLVRPEVAPDIRSWALNYLGDAALHDGDIEHAIEIYGQCEVAARERNDVELIAEVCCDLAELHNRQYERLAGSNAELSSEHEERYTAYVSEALQLVDAVASPAIRARVYRNTAKRARASNDLPTALDFYERSINASDARAAGHRFLIPYAKTLRLADKSDEALQVIDRVLSWSTQVGSRRSEAIARQYRGLVLMTTAGDDVNALAEAQRCLSQAHQQHRLIGFRQGLHETVILLGELALRQGDQASALSFFARSRDRSQLPEADLITAVVAELDANGERDRAQYVATTAHAEIPA